MSLIASELEGAQRLCQRASARANFCPVYGSVYSGMKPEQLVCLGMFCPANCARQGTCVLDSWDADAGKERPSSLL